MTIPTARAERPEAKKLLRDQKWAWLGARRLWEMLLGKTSLGFTILVAALGAAALLQLANRSAEDEAEIGRLSGLVDAIEAESRDLRMQVANFELLADDTALLLRLEEEFLKVPTYRANLLDQLPYLSFKVIEMGKRHREEGLEMSLLLALLEVESAFDPKATSTFTRDGKEYPLAFGLMQVTRNTARPYLEKLGYSWSPEVLYDVETNIEVGVAHLMDLHRQYIELALEDADDWHISVTAYFWGERLTAESLSGSSKDRTQVASLKYWKRVRDAQMAWRERGF